MSWTYEEIVYAALIIFCVILVVSGFAFLCSDECARAKDRRKNRKSNYAKNHFRQTERFRNGIE